jgi:hypothetical protein
LIPAQPARELFNAIIRILARELNAPVFEAHVTFALSEMGPREARKLLKTLKLRPVRLRVNRVEFSRPFTKTLFVGFRGGRALEAAVSGLSRAMGGRASTPPDPHLSLCYKNLSVNAKRELASIIRLPVKEVVFDMIKTVRCASPTTNSRDIRAWRTIAARKLSG